MVRCLIAQWLKYNFDTRECTTQESQCTVVAQREGLSNVRAKIRPRETPVNVHNFAQWTKLLAQIAKFDAQGAGSAMVVILPAGLRKKPRTTPFTLTNCTVCGDGSCHGATCCAHTIPLTSRAKRHIWVMRVNKFLPAFLVFDAVPRDDLADCRAVNLRLVKLASQLDSEGLGGP
jgi:hypothetical protein